MSVRGVEGQSEREGGRVDGEAGDLSADDGRGDVHQGVPGYDVRPVAVRDVGDRLVDREVEVDPPDAPFAGNLQLEGLLGQVDRRGAPYRAVVLPELEPGRQRGDECPVGDVAVDLGGLYRALSRCHVRGRRRSGCRIPSACLEDGE